MAEHKLEMAKIHAGKNQPVIHVDFFSLSFGFLAGVGIYMARKKH